MGTRYWGHGIGGTVLGEYGIGGSVMVARYWGRGNELKWHKCLSNQRFVHFLHRMEFKIQKNQYFTKFQS